MSPSRDGMRFPFSIALAPATSTARQLALDRSELRPSHDPSITR